MGATNNWVKDGLDSYLALTGERRAQRKADDDAANQKQSMALQLESNDRANASARTSNQLAQQSIDKNNADVQDDKFYESPDFDKMLFEHGYKKEAGNPYALNMETVKDPARVAASKQVYSNSLKTVQYIRQMPRQSMSVPYDQMPQLGIPAYVQETARNMFEPAAMKRAGQESYDQATGTIGKITGRMGHINIEKGTDGKDFISADMEVQNPDGSIRYVPFTNGTDDPKQSVKRMPLEALEYEATSQLQGIDDAIQQGIDPSVAITARKLQGMNRTPLRAKKKLLEQMMAEDSNLRTRESDVNTTKATGKKLEALQPNIDALDWKGDPQGSTVKLYSTLTQSGMTTAEVDRSLKIITSAKIPPEKKLEIEEVGAGGNSVQKVIVSKDGKTTPIGKPYQKHASPAGGSDGARIGDLTPKQKAQLSILDHRYNRLAISRDTYAKRTSGADKVAEVEARMAEVEAEIESVLGKSSGQSKKPAANGMTGDGRQTAIPPKGQQPKTPAKGINSFFN